jgi:uncharacterized membrane protein YgdD (TMEM256/DUF423 family)
MNVTRSLAAFAALNGALAVALGAFAALAFLGLRIMGALPPIGGLLMIAAWLLIAGAALRAQPVAD